MVLTGYVTNDALDTQALADSYFNSGSVYGGGFFQNAANMQIGNNPAGISYGVSFGGGPISPPVVGSYPTMSSSGLAPTAASVPVNTSEVGGGPYPPININVTGQPPSGGGGGSVSPLLSQLLHGGGAFIPPNYPTNPSATNVNPGNIPGFSQPAMIGGVNGGGANPFPMPGGQPVQLPPMGGSNMPGGNQVAPWNQLPEQGGGGPFGGMRGPEALRSAMSGRPSPALLASNPPPPQGLGAMAQPGGRDMSAPGYVPSPPPAPRLQPPPPAAFMQAIQGMQTTPSEPQSPFGGPAAKLKAQQPQMAPTQPQPQTPADVAAQAKAMFPGAFGGGKAAYDKSPDEVTKDFREQTQQEIGNIRARYARELQGVKNEIQYAENVRADAMQAAQNHMQNIQQLSSPEALQYRARVQASQLADRQEHDFQRGWLGQLAGGRIPDRLAPRMARESALATNIYGTLVAQTQSLIEREKIGLDYAQKAAEEADKYIKSGIDRYNDLLKSRNDEMEKVRQTNHQFYQDQNNYRNGMSDNQRDQGRLAVDATDSMLRHQDRNDRNEAYQAGLQARAYNDAQRNQNQADDIDRKIRNTDSMIDNRRDLAANKARQGTFEGMTPGQIYNAIKNGRTTGADVRALQLELGRRDGSFPERYSAQQLLQVGEGFKNGTITEQEVRDYKIDPNKLRSIVK